MDSTENPEVIGERLYQAKKYDGAVKYFTKALQQNSENLHHQIYLKRAAALVKQEKYRLAVQDAGSAVRLSPQSPEGYLRLSQVLQLQENDERAIAILEAGLSRMKAGSTGWKSISKHLDKARVRLNLLVKRRDFFDTKNGLPIELVIQIFGYLDQTQLLRCMRVCKGWRTAIRNNSEFFQSLSIRHSISPKPLNRWLNLTENSAYKLKNLSLILKSTEVDKKTQNLYGIVKACQHLKSIRLNISDIVTGNIHELYPWGSTSLEKLVLDGDAGISMTDIEVVMSRLPALKHAEFHAVTVGRGNMVVQWSEMPHLEFIYLAGHRRIGREIPETMLAINKLIAAAPNVTHAAIKNFGKSSSGTDPLDFASWKSLKHLDIERLRTTHMPTFPLTLQYLDLSDIGSVAVDELERPVNDDGTVDGSLFHLPELVHLNVEGSDFTRFMHELSLAGLASGTLKTLKIGDTSIFAPQDDPYVGWPVRMPRPSESLRALSVQGLSHISEGLIIQLLERYPNLDEVDLSETTITGSTLRILFEREHKPQIIEAVGCSKVSRDAVEAARNHCIDVISEYAPQKQIYNGRKHRPHDY